MHQMNVKTKYYNLLKSGKKTIELRLFDEKRQKIKIGDLITFANNADTTDTFQAKVINLHRAANFSALCQKIQPQQAGFSSKEELLNTLEEIYSPSAQNKYGVVGIEISLC